MRRQTPTQPRFWPRLVKPPLHVLRRLAFTMLRLWVARRAVPASTDSNRIRVYFLLEHAFGMGGTIRTVLNLAGHLAPRYDVEVISIVRRRKEAFFSIPAGVRVRFLHDRTREQPLLARLPSLLVHEEDGAFKSCSALTDVRLLRTLEALQPGVLITTRPAFSVLAARLAPQHLVTVAQEHVNHLNHRPGIARAVARAFPSLHAVVVLTEADLRFYRTLCGGSSTVVKRIPNALPPIEPGVPPRRGKIIVSAGRLLEQKRFELLIDAFGTIAAEHPDWRLHIYGSGKAHDALQAHIRDLGLDEQVTLKGRTRNIGAAFSAASLFALTSSHEGFGLVVIEAMSCGLPVISFDSGGPAEIITPGADGLLVPDADTAAFADALRELIVDRPGRERMAATASETAKRFDLRTVGAQWESLLGSLTR